MRHLNITHLVVLAFICTACAPHHIPRVPSSQSDVAAIEMAQAAVSINDSLKKLSDSHYPDSQPELKAKHITARTYGMGRLASVDWDGPAEPLIKRLAELTQYKIAIFGRKPVMPVMVSISERNTMVGDILHDISLQSKAQVKLVVFPASQLIEVHYLSQL